MTSPTIDKHRVAGHVVARVEGADLVEGRLGEVLHVADRQVTVGMVGVEDKRQDLLEDRAVRDVVHPLAALLGDDVDLIAEVLLGQYVVEISHPVGLEPQPEVERAGRHRLEVVGPVEGRRRIE